MQERSQKFMWTLDYATSLTISISFSAKWGQHHLAPGVARTMITGELSNVTQMQCVTLPANSVAGFPRVYLQVSALISVFPFLSEPTEDKCQELSCKCDQEIAYCLAQTEYNLKYLFFPRFFCRQGPLKCD